MPATPAATRGSLPWKSRGLQELGLRFSDLRWLVEKGYAVHAREVTRSADQDRKFPSAQIPYSRPIPASC